MVSMNSSDVAALSDDMLLPGDAAQTLAKVVSLAEISEAMDEFVRDKGWYEVGSKRPQTPRNLATSLAIEAGELLECFQWDERGESERVQDELADVILYAVQLARVTGCNLAQAVTAKLEKNRTRQWDLPVENRA